MVLISHGGVWVHLTLSPTQSICLLIVSFNHCVEPHWGCRTIGETVVRAFLKLPHWRYMNDEIGREKYCPVWTCVVCYPSVWAWCVCVCLSVGNSLSTFCSCLSCLLPFPFLKSFYIGVSSVVFSLCFLSKRVPAKQVQQIQLGITVGKWQLIVPYRCFLELKNCFS